MNIGYARTSTVEQGASFEGLSRPSSRLLAARRCFASRSQR